MNITWKKLKELGACDEGVKWFMYHRITDLRKLVDALLADGHADYARWLVVRLMTHPQQILFACFCARSVLNIFESKYPGDMRPRQAIQAAEDVVTGAGTVEAAMAAMAAGEAAESAGEAAESAWAAAKAAKAAAKAAMAAGEAAESAGEAAKAAKAAWAAEHKKQMAYALALLGE